MSSVNSERQTLSLDTGRIELMAIISWGFVNVTVSSYSFDISWAGVGPMTGTVSSKSWNAWLMSQHR